MKIISLIFFSIFLQLCTTYEEIDELLVEINSGKILGRALVSNSGRTIRAFTGIPYAAPPIGNLRFKQAQKVTPWNNTFIAQNKPAKCLQFNPFIRSFVIEGQEDCLTLNVFAPQEIEGKKFPVIVWFHGGGWTRGDASPYGPEYLLDHDIILVSGEYRVGALGFLSSEDKNVPGNFGLKDQAFILKWVQENIEKFGGDKNSVTIWGESAGGASIHYHMYSPMSRGLFHRAISHSGSLYNCWSDPTRPGVARKNFYRFAIEADCAKSENDNTEEVADCMRKIEAEKLTEISTRSYFWDNDPVVPLQPVIESFDMEEEPFIKERTFANHSVHIPWLIGMNSEEGLLKVGAMFNDRNFLNELHQKWNEILPHSFYYDHLDNSQQVEITKILNEFYFGNETLSETTMSDPKGLIDMWTDGWFIGIFESLKYRFENGARDNTFIFHFTHKSTASFSMANNFLGTCHVDDLIPLFQLRKSFYYSSVPTRHDKELTEKMTKMWTNFATFGNPTPENILGIPQWPTINNITSFKYLQIGNENGKTESLFQLKENYYIERAELWMNLRNHFKLNSWESD
ncbi:hypothetical protein PVAND_016661 [Polypedilum vanderplanki]|uniref:Carboxylic ester hydrolase n=1 Tax=Polypedilum vanderplanki TaxID=319348 RepID=A0A9J6BGZ4_POLVA|nr:hypothetical protein PVAND_016661 [Polypedilum vanderplanki]